MINKRGISRITLGSTQLGLDYGINPVNQVSTAAETHEILKYAFTNGINSIDTSPIYGSSEKRIGKFIKEIDSKEIFVITRLEAQEFSDEIWDDRKALSKRIDKEFELSKTRLNLRQIPAYILHFADQSFKNNGIILDKLVEMKKKGFIKFIGTSLYTGDELERCIEDTRIDVVQLPFSILDRRLLESGLLNKAHRRGLIIFARSIFLQGLVFMQWLPAQLSNAQETIDTLHYLVAICDLSVNELCLRYVLSIKEISVVIGIDSLKQLKENTRVASLGSLDKSILKKVEKLPQMPADLIDIRSWGQNYNFTGEIK